MPTPPRRRTVGISATLVMRQRYGAGMTDKALTELARAHGVATWYEDWQGRRVQVELDVIRAVLAVLDVDISRPRAVRRRSPTVVIRQGQKPPRVPDGVLRAEDGGVREVQDRLPADLTPGWYRLTHGADRTTVIVTPPKLAEPPRTWGWMLQLYALRSTG